MIIGNSMNYESESMNLDKQQSNNINKSLSGFEKKQKTDYFSKEEVDGYLEFFPTLERLVEAADPLEHRFFVARDYQKHKQNEKNQWVKQFYSFPDASSYLQILERLPPEERNWSELIRPDQPVKPVFDIEWYQWPDTPVQNRLDPEEGAMLICDKIKESFRDLFGLELEHKHFRILESHKYSKEQTKFSYHIIIHPFRLKNLCDYNQYLARRVVQLIKSEPSCPLNNVLNPKKVPTVPIDLTVYKQNQLFRMKGHHKENQLNRNLKVPQETESWPEITYLSTETLTEGPVLECGLLSTSSKGKSDSSEQSSQDPFASMCLGIIQIEALNRNDWIKVGTALFNTYGPELGLEYFRDFSKKSEHYDEEGLVKTWKSFKREYRSSAGTIAHYAKTTNPEGYRRFLSSLPKRHFDFTDGTDLNMAFLFYRHNPDRFVCHSEKRQMIWYQFNGHRFQQVSDEEIKKIVITCLLDRHKGELAQCRKLEREVLEGAVQKKEEGLERKREALQSDIREIEKNIKSLGKNSKRNSILGTLPHFYLNEDFPKLQDGDPYLIGFENGVFDLKRKEFRPGRFDDYITLSTGYDYSEGRAHYQEVDDFYHQLFSFSKSVRLFAIRSIARSMIGNNSQTLQSFYIWNGGGGNGKSKLQDAIEYSLGGYVASIDSNLLVQKSVATNQAREDLKKLVGVRFAFASELEETKGEPIRLNSKTVKTYSGEKRFSFRANYGSIHDHPLMFTIYLLCNERPEVNMDDYAITRRFKYCPFMSRFVDVPKEKWEFKRDVDLDERLEQWRMSHFHFLVDHLTDRFEYPSEASEFGQQCMASSDPLFNILGDLFVEPKDPRSGVTLKQFKRLISSHPRAKEVRYSNEEELLSLLKKRLDYVNIQDKQGKFKEYILATNGQTRSTTGVILTNLALKDIDTSISILDTL
jgi:hypothetical protein